MSDETTTQLDQDAVEQLGSARLREFIPQMQRIRRFEERAAREYASGKISGFCHLYIGQEAVAVGTLGAAQPKDHIITAYRDHGHALLRGCSMRAVMAELMGKVTGASKGRGGSMHLFNAEQNFHGGHGIVGAHIPLAVGFAFASAYEDRGEASIAFFGEGALNQGAFYESVNLASLWNLPVVLICENNGYAMGTPLHRASAISDLYKKAAAFGVHGIVCDGMDVAQMWKTVDEACERARTEQRPTLIEARCYRFRGHSMSDPAKYRTKDEVDESKAQDPIKRAVATAIAKGWTTEDEVAAWDAAAKEEAIDSADFARDSPEPDLKDVGKYVYKDPLGWAHDDAMTPHVRD